MQPIRTLSIVPFIFDIVLEQVYLYQVISKEAYKLLLQGLSYVAIGKALGVDDKTAKKAAEYAKSCKTH